MRQPRARPRAAACLLPRAGAALAVLLAFALHGFGCTLGRAAADAAVGEAQEGDTSAERAYAEALRERASAAGGELGGEGARSTDALAPFSPPLRLAVARAAEAGVAAAQRDLARQLHYQLGGGGAEGGAGDIREAVRSGVGTQRALASWPDARTRAAIPRRGHNGAMPRAYELEVPAAG